MYAWLILESFTFLSHRWYKFTV